MENFLRADHLKKSFTLEAGFFSHADRRVYAVNDVSFTIGRGETYGLVGESGCGKTTTARLLVRMYEPTSGAVLYYPRAESDAENCLPLSVTAMKRRELRAYRERVKYIFQDPARSLNPRMSVYGILTAAYRHSSLWPGEAAAHEEAAHLLEETGLCADDLERRPGEFSGGQRQRISIARGLIMQPEALICDEVVSALDVSIQGQILNLLQDIRQKKNLSFLFITHDLAVSCYFCDRIGVMYRGMLVEEAPAADLYKTAVHPYTKTLFAGSQNFAAGSAGEVKSMLQEESGCPFAYRCPHCMEKCRNELPPWKVLNDAGTHDMHKVRCWL